MTRLLKLMVMGLLCDIVIMIYIEYEQMDPYNPSGNVFGYNSKENNWILSFFFIQPGKVFAPDAPTFEINGHGASVWYQYIDINIEWTNGSI